MDENAIEDAEYTPAPPEKSNPERSPGVISLVPLVPVKWTGKGRPWAYGRVAGYGTAGALLWRRNRSAAQLLIGAALLSAATSTLAHSG